MKAQLHEVTGKNRYCGPTAIATVLGVSTDHAAAMIRQQSGKRSVRGTATRHLIGALREAGCTVKHWQQYPKADAKTLAQFVKGSLPLRRQHVIVVAGNHYMTIFGRRALCSMTKRETVALADMPKRRAKVLEWLVVEDLPDAAPAAPVKVKPVQPPGERKAREQAQALAKLYAIEIERERGGSVIVWGPAGLDDEHDPFEGDHYAQDWPDALDRVQQYVAALAQRAADVLK